MSTNGLGYCPCGAGKRHTCQHCGRALCGWHYASRPFDGGNEGVGLGTVCWPVCGAPWWDTAGVERLVRADTPEESETRTHAVRLLRRGGEVEHVAAELGLTEGFVRRMSMELAKQPERGHAAQEEEHDERH